MPSLPSPPGTQERILYYAGLPSRPPLVARNSVFSWKEPTGPEAYPRKKHLSNVGKHPIVHLFDDIAPEIIDSLDSKSVLWTCIDVVRIGYEGENLPVILWIGVKPSSLSGEHAIQVAVACKNLLVKHGITDIECEIREAERVLQPALMKPTLSDDDAVNLRVHLTNTVGVSIASEAHPHVEGSLGFYFSRGGDDKLYALTARHVIFPNSPPNTRFDFKSSGQKRPKVMLPADGTLKRLKNDLCNGIRVQTEHIHRKKIALAAAVESQETGDEGNVAKQVKRHIEDAEDEIQAYNELGMCLNSWATRDSRVIGHAILAPPFGPAEKPDNYMVDWCIIEVDPSKMVNFSGNTIDLGTEIRDYRLNELMNPNIRNAHKFVYPHGRQLPIQGVIPIDELKKPKTLHGDDTECLLVLMRGRSTDVIVGRANEVMSRTRYTGCVDEGGKQIKMDTKEWAIVPYDKTWRPNSNDGDSGAVIIDARGRMGGLLTGGAGATDSTDISYATPACFLLENMEKNGFKANIHIGQQEKKVEDGKKRG